MRHQTLAKLLMLAGALPFLFGAAALILGVENLSIFGDTRLLLASYGLAIASFMSGIHWSLILQLGNKASSPQTTLILSNLLVLLPWFCLVITGASAWTFIARAYVFIKQLMLDRRFHSNQQLATPEFAKAYLALRHKVTIAVVFSLLSAAVVVY